MWISFSNICKTPRSKFVMYILLKWQLNATNINTPVSLQVPRNRSTSHLLNDQSQKRTLWLWKQAFSAPIIVEISVVIRSQLKNAVIEGFNKSELKGIKSKIVNNTAAIPSEMENMKGTISNMDLYHLFYWPSYKSLEWCIPNGRCQ